MLQIIAVFDKNIATITDRPLVSKEKGKDEQIYSPIPSQPFSGWE